VVVTANSATGTITGEFGVDSTQGIAVTPDGSQAFAAQTGKYSVVAINAATGASKTIFVGEFPQDVAVSPDGKTVYATITGPDDGRRRPGSDRGDRHRY
jgi:DNA-binding beta-propeller fold protein YncE